LGNSATRLEDDAQKQNSEMGRYMRSKAETQRKNAQDAREHIEILESGKV
jgi:hypothetical protein